MYSFFWVLFHLFFPFLPRIERTRFKKRGSIGCFSSKLTGRLEASASVRIDFTIPPHTHILCWGGGSNRHVHTYMTIEGGIFSKTIIYTPLQHTHTYKQMRASQCVHTGAFGKHTHTQYVYMYKHKYIHTHKYRWRNEHLSVSLWI